MAGQNPPPFEIERGTLGIVIITRQGIVFAADSRSAKADGTFDDTADKVFRLSDKAACTVAGIVALQHQIFGEMMGFDFPKAIEEYSRNTVAPGSSPMSLMAEWLGRRLTRDLPLGFAFATADPYADGGPIATVVIAGYSDVLMVKNPFMEAYKLALVVATQVGPGPSVRVTASEPTIVRRYWGPDIKRAPFALFTNGNAQVVLAIFESDNEAVQASRNIPAIARFLALRGKGELDSMTLDEATALAEALVRESIRVAGPRLGIGGQIDIAQITEDNGFRWVPGHEPDQKRKPQGNLPATP